MPHTPHDHTVSPWYRNATFYSVDLARFQDSTGNGFGDLKGLVSRLDYLQWLGIDAIWLQPFYTSPRNDNGYDVSDHYVVDPRLGTTGDFVAFLREAERRNIRVIIDLVINHTSNEHRWFRESRQPGSAKRHWYVWADDLDAVPAYPSIFPPTQETTWTWDDTAQAWYLHHFNDFEPDLNTSHDEVRAEIRNMVEYWIRLGVRGFRVDGAPFFGMKREIDEDAVHTMLHAIHTWAAGIEEHTVLLPEADLPPQELAPYAGNGDAQLLFNFLGAQYIFLALATERAEPVKRSLEALPPGAPGFLWLNFLRNQDELTLERLDQEDRHTVLDAFAPDPDMHIYGRGTRRRLAPMLGGDRALMQLAFSLVFALPGSPTIVAGDEIGMGENLDLPERHAARLPMQWSADAPNGGFSNANPDDLVTPVLADGPFGIGHINVDDQRADEASFLHWVRQLIAARSHAFAEIGQVTTRVEVPDERVLVLIHAGADGLALVTVHNLGSDELALEMSDSANRIPLLMTGTRLADDGGSIHLGPRACAWWLQAGAPLFSSIPLESEIV